MSTPRFQAFAFAVALLLPAALAVAGGPPVEKPVAVDSADKLRAIADNVRSEMKPGGRYEFIKAGDRSAVENDLESMAKLLGKAGSVAAMSHDEQLRPLLRVARGLGECKAFQCPPEIPLLSLVHCAPLLLCWSGSLPF